MLLADYASPVGLSINELVTNAAKYAYPSGPGVIEVSARRHDLELVVQVSDHGIGLSPAFEIDGPRKSLGFKLVTSLVRQTNGRLQIETNTPHGTRFSVVMPILKHADAQTQ